MASSIIRTSLAKLKALWHLFRGGRKRPLQGTVFPLQYTIQCKARNIEETEKCRIPPLPAWDKLSRLDFSLESTAIIPGNGSAGFTSASRAHVWAKDGEVPLNYSLPKNMSLSGIFLFLRVIRHSFSPGLMIPSITLPTEAVCCLVD